MTEEEKEKEASKKAEKVMAIQKKIASACAESFEKWCREHKEATPKEATERLEKEVFSAITTSTIMTMLAI